MIIWVASYPRSGNTLTRIALHSLYGIKTHSMHADAPLNKDNLKGPLGFVINARLKSRLPAFRERRRRYLIKTHAVLDRPNYIEEDDRAIYVVRDGRDALISRAHFFADRYKEYEGDFGRTLERLVTNDIRYRPWSESVMTWADRPNTAYVHYEDLVIDPFMAIRDAMITLGVAIPEKAQKMPKFASLHDVDPAFFRAGRALSWMWEMPKELQEVFWENNHRGMEHYGYPY